MKETVDKDLTQLADAAFRVVARKVVERAETTGTPVIVWQDEEVREVPPSGLLQRASRRSRRSKSEVKGS